MGGACWGDFTCVTLALGRPSGSWYCESLTTVDGSLAGTLALLSVPEGPLVVFACGSLDFWGTLSANSVNPRFDFVLPSFGSSQGRESQRQAHHSLACGRHPRGWSVASRAVQHISDNHGISWKGPRTEGCPFGLSSSSAFSDPRSSSISVVSVPLEVTGEGPTMSLIGLIK